jgi:hypothetical protein
MPFLAPLRKIEIEFDADSHNYNDSQDQHQSRWDERNIKKEWKKFTSGEHIKYQKKQQKKVAEIYGFNVSYFWCIINYISAFKLELT